MGKMKHIPLLLLAAVLAVGCSQDDLFDPAGEEQRPLVIKATGLSVTEAGITRATVDGSWDGDETVAVSVTDDEGTFGVFSYTAASDGTLTSSSPYFWKAQPIEVMAWYPYSAEFPTTVTVDADQSTLEGFKGSDALEASRKLTENDCELKFSHRVAKVTFKLTSNGMDLSTMEDVTVVGVTGVDGGGNSVTPYQPDAANHTYQVLLAPQTLAAGKTALTLKVNGFDYAWVPDKDYTLVENYSYTFELTVAANKPQITLTGCTISGWELGASYEENVPFPEGGLFINLSTLTEEYVINDDETYNFFGSGSYGIKVTAGNPNIYLENAQISVSSGHAIDIQRGNPTIHVTGKDNKVSTDDGAGIYVAENYTVTITGNSQEDAITVTGGGGGAGIGAYFDFTRSITNSCGNIHISNVTITAKAISNSAIGDCGSGIGSAGLATVGSIIISNAIVYAEGFAQGRGYYAAAAIGGGYNGGGGGSYQTEFDITISNSTIHATQKCAYSSYIGAAGHYNGPVNYDIISTARITDSTIYKYTDDPSSSDGSVVYDANGNRTDQ